jgi:hypothetical protein
MKQKRKGNLLMKRKPKENGMLSVVYQDVILSFD